ncbi:hypothetical protein OK016_15195 [Vibrio chagasii]|nr:hypothetical protein [Vibrio chagasii]
MSYRQGNGEKVIVVATYNGKLLNSPNDLTVNSDGSVWFTGSSVWYPAFTPSKGRIRATGMAFIVIF